MFCVFSISHFYFRLNLLYSAHFYRMVFSIANSFLLPNFKTTTAAPGQYDTCFRANIAILVRALVDIEVALHVLQICRFLSYSNLIEIDGTKIRMRDHSSPSIFHHFNWLVIFPDEEMACGSSAKLHKVLQAHKNNNKYLNNNQNTEFSRGCVVSSDGIRCFLSTERFMFPPLPNGLSNT